MSKLSINKMLFRLSTSFVLTIMSACGQRTGTHDNKIEADAVCGTSSEVQSNTTSFSSKGGQLFKKNCAMCHSTSNNKITAPGLRGIAFRLPNPAEEYFIKYTLNNERVYKSGDPYAIKLKNSGWGAMTIFDSILTTQDVREIYWFLTKQ